MKNRDVSHLISTTQNGQLLFNKYIPSHVSGNDIIYSIKSPCNIPNDF